MKEIKFGVKDLKWVPFESLVVIQGSLKDLTQAAYEDLKAEIIDKNFNFPFNAWQNPETKLLEILDGTQRHRAMSKMRQEGFEFSLVPVLEIEASSQRDAALKLLGGASSYGVPTGQGLYEFMHSFDITMEDISHVRLAGVDIDEFREEYFEQDEQQTDPDAVPEPPKDPKTKRGELWQLGEHRLLCGDSTVKEDVERLMAGEKADMVFTDPPYGVGYDGGTTKREKLAGDDSTELYGPCCQIARDFSTPNAALYLWHAGVKGIAAAAAAAAAAADWIIRCEIVWNKNHAQFGALSAQYKQKHEPCYYCFKKGKTVNWCGPTNEITVWDIARAPVNEFHPTQKPTALAERALRNHSAKICLDLFGGSGSTLIACEKLVGRSARLVELAPAYCDVILTRWAEYTGKDPVREDGKRWSEILGTAIG